MKQEIPTENKPSLSQSLTAAKLRASRAKETPKADSANRGSPGLKTRPKTAVPEPNNTAKARRSVVLNKLKSGEDLVAQKGREVEERKVVYRPGGRDVEQHVRLQRRTELNCKGIEDDQDEKRKELQQRLDASENAVKDLQAETLSLKDQLEKLQSLNVELESQNKRFAEELTTAEAKIASLSSHHDEKGKVKEDSCNLKFKDSQKLIAGKLEHSNIKEDAKQERTPKMQSAAVVPEAKVAEIQPKVPMSGPPPPPPPPPPRTRSAASKAATMQKAPAIVEFYHSLTKNGRKNHLGTGNSSNPATTNAHSSIVGEIQNRSSHLLAIKTDIETKGDLIKFLIQKVESAAYTDIEDVLIFVDWLDGELSSLADERAVLKHFNWPEKKADAMREAAVEYRDLKRLLIEISLYEDDTSLPCETALKKMACLLDKSERSIHRLIKLRDVTKPSFRECKIPSDWMLDSGMVSKIKLTSLKLAKLYMKRVSSELESLRHMERESMQEALLLQCVRFVYRAHQFAGGLDYETMCAFEEIRQRVPTNGAAASRELVAV
ncbi:hypothetical protein ACLOJK_015747 [Asimina triloba]